MFYVIHSARRPKTTVPYYSNSSPTAAAAAAALGATIPKSPTFHGSEAFGDTKGLGLLFIQKWDSYADYAAWSSGNTEILSSYEAARNAYDEANGITVVQTFLDTEVELF